MGLRAIRTVTGEHGQAQHDRRDPQQHCFPWVPSVGSGAEMVE